MFPMCVFKPGFRTPQFLGFSLPALLSFRLGGTRESWVFPSDVTSQEWHQAALWTQLRCSSSVWSASLAQAHRQDNFSCSQLESQCWEASLPCNASLRQNTVSIQSKEGFWLILTTPMLETVSLLKERPKFRGRTLGFLSQIRSVSSVSNFKYFLL